MPKTVVTTGESYVNLGRVEPAMSPPGTVPVTIEATNSFPAPGPRRHEMELAELQDTVLQRVEPRGPPSMPLGVTSTPAKFVP